MDTEFIRNNFEKLTAEIKDICFACGRNPDEINLVAVSKTFSPEEILEVHKLGHTVFGENKVQELLSKYESLKGYPINWHLVGHLQTNKVKYITDFITLIHSVDSFKLASEIQRHAEKSNRVIDILVQVNTSGEEQKSGVEPENLEILCAEISKMNKIRIKGLMTIGMFTNDEKTIRDNFILLRTFFEKLKSKYPSFEHLSMGMTSDYKIAIEEGATMLRIGSAIFGNRIY